MNIKYLALFMLAFFLGYLASQIISLNQNLQIPFGGEGKVATPGDHLSENQILVYDDKVVLDIKNAQWARFTPTGSMEPVFNENSNAIEITPKSPEDIKVGDIVSYESRYVDGYVIHRVIAIGEDEKGWYAILKGDNNPSNDPEKVRFNQIKRMVVAIVY